MTHKRYAYRRFAVANEQKVRDILRRRTAKRGRTKAIAADAGVTLSTIYEARSGKRPMPPSVAEELGFILAWVRAEELALADKIEAELNQPSMLKEGE